MKINSKDRPQSTLSAKSDKVAKWFVFGALVAIAPIVADSISGSIRHAPNASVSWKEAFEKGELLLVTAGIAGVGAGEVLEGADSMAPTARYWIGGISVLVVLIAAIVYANVASAVRANEPYDHNRLVYFSMFMFIVAVANGVGCVFSTTNRKEAKS